MTKIDTITFWHEGEDGGPARASSVCGRFPLDPDSAHDLAVAETGYAKARGRNRHTLTFPPAPTDSAEALRHVVGAYSQCGRCHLSSSRMSVVHYRGDPGAAVVFLGEGPGREEDELGFPFVGKSGKLQNAICVDCSINPETDVLWANMVGCRPTGAMDGKDRPPTEGELISCSEHITLILRAVRPRVVVCLGKTATKYFWGDNPPDVWQWTRLIPGNAPDDWVMVGHAYHPEYLVRVIGAPSMYKEYAASRSFYEILKGYVPGLTKVSSWHFMPHYVQTLVEPKVSWHC